jgi:hypothetical protein
VGSYTFEPGADDDDARLWINPAPGTFGAASPPLETVLADAESIGGSENLAAGGIQSFHVRNVDAATSGIGWDPVFQMDELRIGTTWASVTIPEPASLGLLMIGCVLLVIRRQRT